MTMRHQRPTVDCSTVDPVTKQAFKDECDINNIIRRYDQTGLLTHMREGDAQYIDVSEVSSYRDALNQINEVESHFLALPSALRESFDNDPGTYLDWLKTTRPSEMAERIDDALSPPDHEPTPPPAETAPPPPEAPPVPLTSDS